EARARTTFSLRRPGTVAASPGLLIPPVRWGPRAVPRPGALPERQAGPGSAGSSSAGRSQAAPAILAPSGRPNAPSRDKGRSVLRPGVRNASQRITPSQLVRHAGKIRLGFRGRLATHLAPARDRRRRDD